jgi:hypothetical protein
MSFRKNKLLAVTAFFALSIFGAATPLDFCKKDKAQCEI